MADFMGGFRMSIESSQESLSFRIDRDDVLAIQAR